MKKKGFWFYGLSGCGKTFASKYLNTKIKNSVLIDGDDIRKHISFDLGYSTKDREIQITRVLGLAKVIQKSKFVPIISIAELSDATTLPSSISPIQRGFIPRGSLKAYSSSL